MKYFAMMLSQTVSKKLKTDFCRNLTINVLIKLNIDWKV